MNKPSLHTRSSLHAKGYQFQISQAEGDEEHRARTGRLLASSIAISFVLLTLGIVIVTVRTGNLAALQALWWQCLGALLIIILGVKGFSAARRFLAEWANGLNEKQ